MLFNIDEKQLMLELKNKDERALKICMNKYYRYVVYIVENIIVLCHMKTRRRSCLMFL